MKFIKEKRNLVIIILIVILVIIGLILFFKYQGKNQFVNNNYVINDEQSELPGTVKYSNEQLSIEHCLNNICISDAVFYYNDSFGRVEYSITNNSKNVASGYLKMVFDEQTLMVVYKNLSPGDTVRSKSQYSGVEIKNKDDYKLKKLTKKEISQIVE